MSDLHEPGALVRVRGRTEPLGGRITMWDGRARDEDLSLSQIPTVEVRAAEVGVVVEWVEWRGSPMLRVLFPSGLCMWWAAAFDPAGGGS